MSQMEDLASLEIAIELMPSKQRFKVEACAREIRSSLSVWQEEGLIALALVGLEESCK